MGRVSPSLGSQMADAQPPPGHFRPLSPSLELAELMPCRARRCSSPSLGLHSAGGDGQDGAARQRARVVKARMTTAVCRRASRMARSEPSPRAQAEAQRIVYALEHTLREAGLERVVGNWGNRCSSWRWRRPARARVRVDTGDAAADAVAPGNDEPHGLYQEQARRVRHARAHLAAGRAVLLPQMYGRLAANAIKSNAVNSSVTKREKTHAANQTSRINCKSISQAAAAQTAAVAEHGAGAKAASWPRAGTRWPTPWPPTTTVHPVVHDGEQRGVGSGVLPP